MTDPTMPLFSPATPAKRWRIVMHDGETRVVEAAACRIETGTVIFSEPAGLVVALAAGMWTSVEMAPEVQP